MVARPHRPSWRPCRQIEHGEILHTDRDAVLLDIRTPEEFSSERIDGALNIDFYAPGFAGRLDGLDKAATYVVYCRSGNRSAQAMPMFDDLGFTSVYEVAGGILNWAASGLEVAPGG